MDLVDPFVSYLGVESGDPIGHKRFLALFSGGMLPIISLSFLHMLVKFEEDEKKEEIQLPEKFDVEELSTLIGKQEAELEKEKYTPTNEELEKLEIELIKLNEQKFGVLEEEPTGTDGPEDSSLVEIEETPSDGIKRLNYVRRDA
jgi:hypothetical protein